VVEYLEQAEEAGVTEISNSVGVSKSTVHNHLTTLRESGYVVNEDGRYRLGLRFLRIGETMRMQTDLFEIARPQIEALVEGLDLVGNLSVEEQEKASTCTDPAEATTSDFRRGLARHDLHCTATGKSILAHASSDRLETLLEPMEPVGHTENTITEKGSCWTNSTESVIAASRSTKRSTVRAPVRRSSGVRFRRRGNRRN